MSDGDRRFAPVWEVERDAEGMPCRMWLAGWAERTPKKSRVPKIITPEPEDTQEALPL